MKPDQRFGEYGRQANVFGLSSACPPKTARSNHHYTRNSRGPTAFSACNLPLPLWPGQLIVGPMMTPADRRYLLAAEGWLELGDWQSANDELEHIQPEQRAHPDVLKMRIEIFSAARKWHHVIEVAEALARELPDDPFGHVRHAYALHELKRTAEAFAALSPVVSRFPKDWVIPYNLACYTAQLGRMAEARDWLDRALKISDQPTLTRLEAMDDPDLAPLWKEDKKSKTG